MNKIVLSSLVFAMTICSFAEPMKIQDAFLVAHRGCMEKGVVENTLDAFKRSYDAGVRGYETDVRITKDGHLVILHNATPEHIFGVDKMIETMTIDEVSKLRSKKGNHPLPTLEQVLDFFADKPGCYIEWEMKTSNRKVYTDELLHEYCKKLHDQALAKKPKDSVYTFTSFSLDTLKVMRELDANCDIGYITVRPCDKECILKAKEVKANRICCGNLNTSRKMVREAQKEGFQINVWPGMSIHDYYLAKGLGANISCVNIPITILNHMNSKKKRIGDAYDYKELVTREVKPVKITKNDVGNNVVDFGRDAIGWLELDGPEAGAYEIVIGELTNERGEVTNAYRKSTIRSYRIKGTKPSGTHRVPLPPDRLNLKGHFAKAPAILLPEKFGIVAPFRYVEVVSGPKMNFRQIAVNYPIDMSKSSFACDNENLARVYDFCKYSILATSFCGVYVDGDRERTPYEADAYINQLCQYAIDDDYSLARKSHEWLMDHPTWPTEWRQHSVMIAWADWMWTGDTRSLEKYYEMLKNEKLMDKYARASDGLLETGGELKKGAKPGAGDIVDWPRRERDNFVFKPVNAVVNAFYYRNLCEMADIARALGKKDDAQKFENRSKEIYATYQKVFFDEKSGLYVDGDGANHSSLHANAAALAFGLVPQSAVTRVIDFLEKKGMACSVYFAQYLLEAFCRNGRADIAIKLMSAKGDRTWMGMIDFGSTITLEAWSIKDKPNLDLNHAWGAVPLNIISRYVLGVTPKEAGFKKISIRPQLGNLKHIKGTIPTVAGKITVEATPEKLIFTTPSPTEVFYKGELRQFPAGTHEM